MTTREYEVFYQDTLIGILEVHNETGKHKYTPNEKGVEATKDNACHIRVMIEGTNGFEDPIPFFDNRLSNGERLGLTVINYQTDKYTLKLKTTTE